jgi:hypothetical protein
MREVVIEAEDANHQPITLKFFYRPWPARLLNAWEGQSEEILDHMEILHDGEWRPFP